MTNPTEAPEPTVPTEAAVPAEGSEASVTPEATTIDPGTPKVRHFRRTRALFAPAEPGPRQDPAPAVAQQARRPAPLSPHRGSRHRWSGLAG